MVAASYTAAVMQISAKIRTVFPLNTFYAISSAFHAISDRFVPCIHVDVQSRKTGHMVFRSFDSENSVTNGKLSEWQINDTGLKTQLS